MPMLLLLLRCRRRDEIRMIHGNVRHRHNTNDGGPSENITPTHDGGAWRVWRRRSPPRRDKLLRKHDVLRRTPHDACHALEGPERRELNVPHTADPPARGGRAQRRHAHHGGPGAALDANNGA